ncbi:MAG: hypothetical protein HKO59_02355 [Phycisphaerales bacterium]|nr:hypothetical protein [Phycisphaerae bacterium]NNM24824.1 hypothetical protein [Phycisphaerales bacterium]
MAKRSSSTPLYELIMRREASGRHEPEPEPVEEGAAPSRWLSGGRVVRVPVGYILLSSAAVMVLLIGSYLLGATRAEESTRAEYERFLASGLPPTGMPAQDPLEIEGETRPGETHRVLATPAPDLGPGVAAEPAAARPPDAEASAEDELLRDPREAGLYYYVLAETREEGALRMARFCLANGLDACVLPRHNDRFHRVIALPGVPVRDESDIEVRRLRQRVLAVGEAWRREHPGERDFSEAYLIP